MLAALVEIPYYEQLRKADTSTVEALRTALDRGAHGALVTRAERRGRFLYTVPPEPRAALLGALTRVLALKRSLGAIEAVDPICLLYDSGADEQGADREADRLLARLEASAGVGTSPWRVSVLVHQGAVEALGTAARLAGEGEFRVLEGITGSPAEIPPPAATPEVSPVSRAAITDRIVDAVFASIQEESPRRPILVVGPDGSGKARAVADATAVIVGESVRPDVVVIHPLANRKSAIHPFLNSIRAEHWEQAPRFLHPWERDVWAEKEGLVRALLGDEQGGDPAASVCPDRVSVDFAAVYRLYLLSYVRRMEHRGVPALLVVENLHTFHAEALQLCVDLLAGLTPHPTFVVVLTCRAGHDATAALGADVTALPVHPVTLGEIRAAAQALYPGVKLPEKTVRRIREQTGGQLTAIQHCLGHLARSGKIARGEDGYTWVTGIPSRIPASPQGCAWEQIEASPVEHREMLYLAALGAGVLSADALVGIASVLGEGDREARAERAAAALEALAEDGLIRSAREPHPTQPRLKTRLATVLGAWAARAREKVADHLVDLWRSGRTRRLVLIYSVLRTERPQVALEILGAVVTQKLDELNVRGCHFFLDPAKLRVTESTTEVERARFERISAMGELRSSLLQGAWQRAEAAMDAVTNLEIPERASGEHAQRALEQSRFHLVKGDAPAAAKAAKSSVIQYHEAGDEACERRAETELGAALLADGRLEEASEYFGFVSRSSASPAFPRVRAAALGTVASYLLGNYSASIRFADEGIRVATEAGRREWEAFLLFLRARQRFDLGQFDDAVVSLERLAGFARVYGMGRVSQVAARWRARCLAHAGDGTQALKLWERLPDSEEARFFRAEGLYLQGQISAALALLSPLEPARRRPAVDPGERISWESGYASVEERCVALRRDGGTVSRLLRGFRAYLTALDGKPEQAMRELYRITREERVTDLDPYLPLYSYWYAATLPEEGGEGTDHKLTILNRAMKHLQQRSSRIENARDRSQLMTANYWNGRLLEEGRARHLV